MMKLQTWILAMVAMLLLSSSIGVIWSKHQSRTAFIQLQRLQNERDRLDIEWGQLKLEQSAWSTHGRVEQVAHTNLKMIVPQPNAVLIVQP